MLLLCLDSDKNSNRVYLFIHYLFFFNIYIYIYTYIVEYTERNMFLDDFGSSCSAVQFLLPGYLGYLDPCPRHKKQRGKFRYHSGKLT